MVLLSSGTSFRVVNVELKSHLCEQTGVVFQLLEHREANITKLLRTRSWNQADFGIFY